MACMCMLCTGACVYILVKLLNISKVSSLFSSSYFLPFSPGPLPSYQSNGTRGSQMVAELSSREAAQNISFLHTNGASTSERWMRLIPEPISVKESSVFLDCQPPFLLQLHQQTLQCKASSQLQCYLTITVVFNLYLEYKYKNFFLFF